MQSRNEVQIIREDLESLQKFGYAQALSRRLSGFRSRQQEIHDNEVPVGETA